MAKVKVAIAADTIYGFDVPPCGLSFVNFRASLPTATTQNGTVLLDEAGFWGSRIGRPHYAQGAN